MQFKDVIGQQQVKANVTEMLIQNRLSHALLFLGKEGVGALSLALSFAQYVVCEHVFPKKNEPSLFGEPEVINFKPPTDSCGVCPSCLKAGQLHSS